MSSATLISLQDLSTTDIENRREHQRDVREFLTPTKKPRPESDQEPRRAWLIVFATWLVQFCTYGYVSSFGVYQDYYTREFLNNKNPSEISWIGSVQLFLQYALGVGVGRIYDMGYLYYLFGIGTALEAISLFMLSLTRPHHYSQVFLSQAVGMGLGQAMIFLPSISVVSHHFKKRSTMAIGIAVSGAPVGGIIWPMIINLAIQNLGFPNATRLTAAILTTFLLVANVLYFIAGSNTSPSRQGNTSGTSSFRLILADWAYLTSILSAFCANLGLFFPYFYLQSYALSMGLHSFHLLALLNVGSVFGRLLPSFLANKFGIYNLLIPSLFISSALIFALLGIRNSSGLAVSAVLYGFCSGSYVSLIPSLLVRLSTSPAELGIRMGIAFSIVAISLLAGTPIEGVFIQGRTGRSDWNGSIIFCGTMIACGSVVMFISRLLYIQNRSISKHERCV